jgi:hypothetical protein
MNHRDTKMSAVSTHVTNARALSFAVVYSHPLRRPLLKHWWPKLQPGVGSGGASMR